MVTHEGFRDVKAKNKIKRTDVDGDIVFNLKE